MQDWHFYCFHKILCLELCKIVCFCKPQTKNPSSKQENILLWWRYVLLVPLSQHYSLLTHNSQKRYKQRVGCKVGESTRLYWSRISFKRDASYALMGRGVERRAMRGARDRGTNKGCSGWQQWDTLPAGVFSWVWANYYAFYFTVCGQRSVYTLSVTQTSVLIVVLS